MSTPRAILATVKRCRSCQLNLCGGALDSSEATPLVQGAGPGFVADPGTQQTEGELPIITRTLNALGEALQGHDLWDQRLPDAGAQRRGRRLRG